MEDLLWLMLMIVFIGIPGGAMAIHMVLRPLLKELTSAVKSIKGGTENRDLERRVQELEDVTAMLQHNLTRAVEAAQFHEALEAGEAVEPAVSD